MSSRYIFSMNICTVQNCIAIHPVGAEIFLDQSGRLDRLTNITKPRAMLKVRSKIYSVSGQKTVIATWLGCCVKKTKTNQNAVVCHRPVFTSKV